MTFHDFLSQIRPLVNASGLEKAAGLPSNTLGKHYRHADGKPNGQPCHQKHFPAIVRALCATFGVIEIDGWRITCETDGPAIFASRPIPEREAEITEPQPGNFEYLQPEWRQVYDDFDFATYFSGELRHCRRATLRQHERQCGVSRLQLNTMLQLNTIHNMKCETGLTKLPDESIDCFVTSPPYGGLRQYQGFEWDFEMVAAEMFRTLKPGGVICWNTGDQIIDGVAKLYPERQKIHFAEMGLLVWDTIFWKKHGVPCPTPNRYYSVIEQVFVLSKGKPKSLNLLSDRVNISAGQRQTTHKRSSREYRERSTRKPYVTAETGRRTNVWEYPTMPNETNHPAVMNLRLAYDLIASYTDEQDLVCDPFAGSGTTFAAAERLCRRWIGFEISADYITAANRRLVNLTHNLFSNSG